MVHRRRAASGWIGPDFPEKMIGRPIGEPSLQPTESIEIAAGGVFNLRTDD